MFTDLDKKIITIFAKLADKGHKGIGHKELALHLKKDPPLFRGHLLRLERMGLLRSKGWKKNQQMFTMTKKGIQEALLIGEPHEMIERKKVKVTRKLGFPDILTTTKEEEKVVSPIPSTITDESESSVEGGLGTPQFNLKASYAEKHRQKMEFRDKSGRKRIPKDVDRV